jgi:hypothetical protein
MQGNLGPLRHLHAEGDAEGGVASLAGDCVLAAVTTLTTQMIGCKDPSYGFQPAL